MANQRRQFSQAEETELTAQVDSRCPLCDASLFYKKKSRTYKAFELAHIFPLNPTDSELLELKGAERLGKDVNDTDNILALCPPCHTKVDKPRTRAEYDDLVTQKKRLLKRSAQRSLNAQYPLEKQVATLIANLHALAATAGGSDLQFEPKGLDDKFEPTMPGPLRRKIKNAVADYYLQVRSEFGHMERQDPSSSALIFSQVRTFYLKQKSLGATQPETFANIVDWIRRIGDPDSLEAAEIVASFFVQNCEVFE